MLELIENIPPAEAEEAFYANLNTLDMVAWHGLIGLQQNWGGSDQPVEDDRSELASVDWAVPDYTTLCRRQKTLAVQFPYLRADGSLNLLADSRGIKFLGDGERARKVHLAMDAVTPDIQVVEFTPSSDGDSPILPELLNQITEGEEIGTMIADGAYGALLSSIVRPRRSFRSASH